MIRIIVFGWLLLGCLPESARAGTPAHLAARGDSAYSAGDYEAAVAAYSQALEQGFGNAALHYNLGNAWYRLARPGPAILHYERARLISPRDSDILHNLGLARQLVSDPIPPLAPPLSEQVMDWLSTFFPTNTLAIVAMACWWLAWAGFGWWRWAGRRSQKKAGFLLGILFLFLSLPAAWLSDAGAAMREDSGRVVVTEARATLRSAPDANGLSLRQVPEGSTLVVLDVWGGYWQVRLPDGETGWLEQSLAARI